MSLRIRFRYEPMLAGGKGYASETKPILHVCLTHHISGDRIFAATGDDITAHEWLVEFPLSKVRLTKVIADEQLLPLKENERGDTLPASSKIVFNAYASTETDQKQWTRVRAGTAFVSLREPVLNTWIDVVQNTGDYGELEKGRIKLTAFEWIDAKPTFDSTPKPANALSAIDRAMAFYFGEHAEYAKPTFSFLKRIHCPEDRTAFGSLPGSAYVLRVPCQLPEQRVYEQLLEVALRRSDMDAEELADIGEAQMASDDNEFDPRFAALVIILARTVSILPNSFVYEDDFVNASGATKERDSRGAWQKARRGVSISEDYKIARLVYGGDCEDVADESRIELHQLRRMNVVGDSANARLLRVLKQMVDLFVVCLVLGDVTNKKLESTTIDAGEAMAHTFCCLIPRYWFCTAMIPTECVGTSLLNQMKAARLAGLREWEQIFRMIVVPEGTAPKDPRDLPQDRYYPDADDLEKARIRLASKHSFLSEMFSDRSLDTTRMQTESFQEQLHSTGRDFSGFYKAPVSLYTADFRQFGVLDFTFVDGQQSTYGVTYNQLLETAANVQIAPSLRLTDIEARVVDDTLMMQEVIPRLTLSEKSRSALMPARYASLVALSKSNPLVPQEMWSRSNYPLPSHKVVCTYRELDVNDMQLAQIVNYVRRELDRGKATGVRFSRTTLIDPPVPGDDMPSLVILDIEFSLP